MPYTAAPPRLSTKLRAVQAIRRWQTATKVGFYLLATLTALWLFTTDGPSHAFVAISLIASIAGLVCSFIVMTSRRLFFRLAPDQTLALSNHDWYYAMASVPVAIVLMVGVLVS